MLKKENISYRCMMHQEDDLNNRFWISAFYGNPKKKKTVINFFYFQMSCKRLLFWIQAKWRGIYLLDRHKLGVAISSLYWMVFFYRFNVMYLKVLVEKFLWLLVVDWGNCLDWVRTLKMLHWYISTGFPVSIFFLSGSIFLSLTHLIL